MSENRIYEITRLMQSPDNFKRDIDDAMEIVAKHFRNKYIAPIEQEVKCCSEKCRNEPVKEAVLLEACRPFVKNTKNIDMILEIINSLSVIQRLAPFKVSTCGIEDSSIHNDGVYDIDKSCRIGSYNTESLFGGSPIMILVILILLFN